MCKNSFESSQEDPLFIVSLSFSSFLFSTLFLTFIILLGYQMTRLQLIRYCYFRDGIWADVTVLPTTLSGLFFFGWTCEISLFYSKSCRIQQRESFIELLSLQNVVLPSNRTFLLISELYIYQRVLFRVGPFYPHSLSSPQK